MTRPAESADAGLQTSAFSLKALAAALAPLMRARRRSLVGLDFDATVAWPIYDWMGVAKAALESVSPLPGARPRARRACASTSSRPARSGRSPRGASPASSSSPTLWRRQAPLGWDVDDPAPVADARICFLLSDYARAITGEIVHVDGGFHAVGAPVQPV